MAIIPWRENKMNAMEKNKKWITLVYSFFDSSYDPRLVAIAVHTQSQAMHLEVDSFSVDLN